MKKASHTAELAKFAASLPALIAAVDDEVTRVAARMAQLKKGGLIYATEHWRKDSDDRPKYLYLLFPQVPGQQRRRDYVGCDVERIQAAQAGIARAKEYDALAGTLAALTRRIADATGNVRAACEVLKLSR